MRSERWTLLERIFTDSLALPMAERPAFLVHACGDDAELRREVDELLRSHDAPGVLDTGPYSSSRVAPQPSLLLGTCLGPWQIEKLIGRGGMGEVYAVTRADAGFEQRAALKLLRYEAVAELQRFHAERRILARLEHPGIARLLDGGTTPDGRPYTVMEFVEGRSLTDFCRERRSSLPERLALFAQVCDAVAFAHRNLVIHRDLKPDNILVTAQGAVKLLDFGIAKLLDAAASPGAADVTIAPFTPDYAAPEQLSGQPVTTATDIYALGVLLFELLTGERPLRTRGLPSTQALKLVFDRQSPAPSRIARTSADAPLPARALSGDLDAIVAKCLRKESTHRYETVIGLKRDLERHLRNEPVAARSGARAYVARRFVRRHWLAIAGVSSLVLGLGAAALYANQARLRTEQALRRADAVRSFVVDLFQQNDPDAGNSRAMTARELVDLGVRRIEAGIGGDQDTRIELLGVSGNLYRALGERQRGVELLAQRLDQADLAYAPDDARRIEAQLDMANAHIGSDHFELASTLLDQALRSAAPDRAQLLPLRADILLARAWLESERDNNQQAIEWSRQAIELHGRVPTTKADERALALNSHSRYIFLAGKTAEAEETLRATLAQLERDSPNSLSALTDVRANLGVVLTSRGRFDEALPLLKANAASLRQLLGDQHPLLADALHQLASTMRRTGDATFAIPIFQEALAIYESRYGLDHTHVAAALTSLGQALSFTGQHQQAIDALERARGIYLKALGPLHSFTAISTVAMARALQAANNFAGAEAEFRAALETFGKIGDGKHINAETARLGLGKLLAADGRCDAAEGLLRQAKDRIAEEFGVDDSRAIDAAAALAKCLVHNGRRDQARALLDDSERALAASNRDVQRQRELISAARQKLDDG